MSEPSVHRRRFAVFESDPARKHDRVHIFVRTREEALALARALNREVIERCGVPERGSPVVLYYTVGCRRMEREE